MGITSLIAAGGAQPDIAGGITRAFEARDLRQERGRQIQRQETQDVRSEEDRQLNRELQQEEIFSQQLENISDRDKARVDSLGRFGREIKPILEEAKITGDFTQFNAALDIREADIDATNEKFPRLGLDKNETTELRGLVEAGSVDEAIDLSGEAIRIQSLQSAGGGVVGELMDRLKKENPNLTDLQALQQVKGGLKDGTLIDEEGNLVARGGAVETTAEFAGAEAFAKRTSDLTARLNLEPEVEAAVKGAIIVAEEKGELQKTLNERVSQIPQLEKLVDELSVLGKKATFTVAGQARDAALRQLNLPVGEGAEARVAYISKIDNEILPLLRQTFGAQFTEREGASLKATLGDKDLSPNEKDAVLKSFISTKLETIASLKRQIGQEAEQPTGEPQVIDFSDLPE